MLMLLLCRVLPGGGASPVLAELSTSASLKESTVSKSAGRALSHDACTDIPLVQGWQVVSFQCSGEAPNGFDMLSSVSFGQNDIIMTRDGTVVFATYDGAAWQGQLKATGLSYARGYKVLFSGPAVSVITQSGEPQLPVEDVVLSGGWNWIGHAPLENYEINSGIEVVSGQLSVDDRIKTRSGNTLSQSTFDGTEFQGPLSKLKPGVGYEFYVAQLVTFRYRTGEAGRPLPPPPPPPSPPSPPPCVQCTDKATDYMVSEGLACATWTWGLDNRCKGSKWINNEYCQQSCFDSGHGYADCCASPPPSPPPVLKPVHEDAAYLPLRSSHSTSYVTLLPSSRYAEAVLAVDLPVHEDLLTAVVRHDEAEALLLDELLHDTGRHRLPPSVKSENARKSKKR